MIKHPIGFLLPLGIIVFLAMPPLARCADDLAVVSIDLNGEIKGEFVVGVNENSDFLINADDLKKIGFRNPQGRAILIENKNHLSLKSMSGVSFTFDEPHLTIQIKADPALLKRIELDFVDNTSKQGLIYPHDSSLLLNYGLRQDVDRGTGASTFSATQEAGMRIGDFLLVSNSIFTLGSNHTGATRLMTSLTRDDRTSLVRTTIGDIYASSGNLGSILMLGGISYGKSYSIEPSFLKRPAMDYTGFLALPSQVDIYMDGVQIRSEKLSPGEFNLKNIAADSGQHGMEVRIRDALGREQTMDMSFYSSEALLKKGLHDYSYNVGLLRNAYGVESSRYSGLALSGFHRYGLTSHATVGFRLEAGARLINSGPQLTLSISRYGNLDVGLAMDAGQNTKKGMAASLSHNYLGRHINLRFQGIAYSRNYRTVSSIQIKDLPDPPRLLIESGVGFNAKKFGSVSLGLSGLQKYSGTNRNAYSITYTRPIKKDVSFSMTYQHVHQDTHDNQIHASLTCYLHKETTVSSTYQHQDQISSEAVQVQKNPPPGEGLSYRALLQHFNAAGQSVTTVYPFVQMNSKVGVYTAEYRHPMGDDSSSSDSFAVSATGSLVYASGAWGMSRPVSDSFAIVDTNRVKNVRVYFNNHEIGATNRAGKIVIPMLNSYVDNLLAISDQDIPINYVLDNVSQRLSPSWRSGALIEFKSQKTQALSGTLFLKTQEGEKPVEFVEIAIQSKNGALKFTTGRDGEFYLENQPAGKYQVNFRMGNNDYTFTLTIPDSEQMLVDLGKVTVEAGN
jgi:outer membrane usher protein